MRFQENPWFCGVAVLQTAATILGLNPPNQKRIARLAGTTEEDGTDEQDMLRGAIALGMQVDTTEEEYYGLDGVYPSKTKAGFISWMTANLVDDWMPTALCVDRWEHWVLAFTMTASYKVICFDPSNSKRNVASGGIRVYTLDELAKRVYAGRKKAGKQGAYYGVAFKEGLSREHL